MKSFGLATILLAGLFVLQTLDLLGYAPKHLKQQSQSWEYRITSVKDDEFSDLMKKAGEEGWELVFARRAVQDKSDFEAAKDRGDVAEMRRIGDLLLKGANKAMSPQSLYEMILKRAK
jgi:hypothetical protein